MLATCAGFGTDSGVSTGSDVSSVLELGTSDSGDFWEGSEDKTPTVEHSLGAAKGAEGSRGAAEGEQEKRSNATRISKKSVEDQWDEDLFLKLNDLGFYLRCCELDWNPALFTYLKRKLEAKDTYENNKDFDDGDGYIDFARRARYGAWTFHCNCIRKEISCLDVKAAPEGEEASYNSSDCVTVIACCFQCCGAPKVVQQIVHDVFAVFWYALWTSIGFFNGCEMLCCASMCERPHLRICGKMWSCYDKRHLQEFSLLASWRRCWFCFGKDEYLAMCFGSALGSGLNYQLRTCDMYCLACNLFGYCCLSICESSFQKNCFCEHASCNVNDMSKWNCTNCGLVWGDRFVMSSTYEEMAVGKEKPERQSLIHEVHGGFHERPWREPHGAIFGESCVFKLTEEQRCCSFKSIFCGYASQWNPHNLLVLEQPYANKLRTRKMIEMEKLEEEIKRVEKALLLVADAGDGQVTNLEVCKLLLDNIQAAVNSENDMERRKAIKNKEYAVRIRSIVNDSLTVNWGNISKRNVLVYPGDKRCAVLDFVSPASGHLGDPMQADQVISLLRKCTFSQGQNFSEAMSQLNLASEVVTWSMYLCGNFKFAISFIEYARQQSEATPSLRKYELFEDVFAASACTCFMLKQGGYYVILTALGCCARFKAPTMTEGSDTAFESRLGADVHLAYFGERLLTIYGKFFNDRHDTQFSSERGTTVWTEYMDTEEVIKLESEFSHNRGTDYTRIGHLDSYRGRTYAFKKHVVTAIYFDLFNDETKCVIELFRCAATACEGYFMWLIIFDEKTHFMEEALSVFDTRVNVLKTTINLIRFGIPIAMVSRGQCMLDIFYVMGCKLSVCDVKKTDWNVNSDSSEDICGYNVWRCIYACMWGSVEPRDPGLLLNVGRSRKQEWAFRRTYEKYDDKKDEKTFVWSLTRDVEGETVLSKIRDAGFWGCTCYASPYAVLKTSYKAGRVAATIAIQRVVSWVTETHYFGRDNYIASRSCARWRDPVPSAFPNPWVYYDREDREDVAWNGCPWDTDASGPWDTDASDWDSEIKRFLRLLNFRLHPQTPEGGGLISRLGSKTDNWCKSGQRGCSTLTVSAGAGRSTYTLDAEEGSLTLECCKSCRNFNDNPSRLLSGAALKVFEDEFEGSADADLRVDCIKLAFERFGEDDDFWGVVRDEWKGMFGPYNGENWPCNPEAKKCETLKTSKPGLYKLSSHLNFFVEVYLLTFSTMSMFKRISYAQQRSLCGNMCSTKLEGTFALWADRSRGFLSCMDCTFLGNGFCAFDVGELRTVYEPDYKFARGIRDLINDQRLQLADTPAAEGRFNSFFGEFEAMGPVLKEKKDQWSGVGICCPNDINGIVGLNPDKHCRGSFFGFGCFFKENTKKVGDTRRIRFDLCQPNDLVYRDEEEFPAMLCFTWRWCDGGEFVRTDGYNTKGGTPFEAPKKKVAKGMPTKYCGERPGFYIGQVYVLALAVFGAYLLGLSSDPLGRTGLESETEGLESETEGYYFPDKSQIKVERFPFTAERITIRDCILSVELFAFFILQYMTTAVYLGPSCRRAYCALYCMCCQNFSQDARSFMHPSAVQDVPSLIREDIGFETKRTQTHKFHFDPRENNTCAIPEMDKYVENRKEGVSESVLSTPVTSGKFDYECLNADTSLFFQEVYTMNRIEEKKKEKDEELKEELKKNFTDWGNAKTAVEVCKKRCDDWGDKEKKRREMNATSAKAPEKKKEGSSSSSSSSSPLKGADTRDDAWDRYRNMKYAEFVKAANKKIEALVKGNTELNAAREDGKGAEDELNAAEEVATLVRKKERELREVLKLLETAHELEELELGDGDLALQQVEAEGE